jgi:hypothetical protein
MFNIGLVRLGNYDPFSAKKIAPDIGGRDRFSSKHDCFRPIPITSYKASLVKTCFNTSFAVVQMPQF